MSARRMVWRSLASFIIAASRWLASWWPRARLLEVPNADHLTVLYSPEVLAAMRSLMHERRTAGLAGPKSGLAPRLRGVHVRAGCLSGRAPWTTSSTEPTFCGPPFLIATALSVS